MAKKRLYIFLFLFTLSGFSGLIYESIWTHYLKLFLGHAAYAQTLVLAIFMGGMALGSGICSRYSSRLKNLLMGYALAEGLVGLFAICFHTIFVSAVQTSYFSVIPHLTSPTVAYVYKWTLSALLILPQSILLGMTFPLMSAGIIRLSPKNPGRTISLLYVTNSFGAALGVLMSGFVLIGLIGLPGTVRLAGLINIGLAVSVWQLMKGQQATALVSKPDKARPQKQENGNLYPLFLTASFVTGAASFIYEIGWLRMLSLTLGSSTHAFELMISAFIFGLACGGLWIQGRIDRITAPARYLAFVQVAMGLLALSTLVLYGYTFDVMQWLVGSLSKTDAGYMLFNLSGNAIALAIMVPTTFCAGMTLPLITYILIKQGSGERSIGAVYAANTVGAIAGVFFAIHIGMPVLGLKGLITVGASLDIGLGVILLWRAVQNSSKRPAVLAIALSACAVVAVLFLVSLDEYKMASGVYRRGELLDPENSSILYYQDGKTSTVSITRLRNGSVSLRTNGKVDAAMNMDPRSGAGRQKDEDTMILLGVIPMALHPEARAVATIGFGSGLTTHTLLGNPLLKQVDTVEIERNIVDASRKFRPRVELAYTDPRSHIFFDDAKTFFSIGNRQYDIIISEPSNPWVSGVAGLFSEEFYAMIKRHLTEKGIFVQWVQLYEIDTDLVMSILKAISSNFSTYVIYGTNDEDMLIVAGNGKMPDLDRQMLKNPQIAAALNHLQIRNVQDIEIRKMGDKQYMTNLLATFPIRANSDYYPVLDQNAARTRFLDANAGDLHKLSHHVLPAADMLLGAVPSSEPTNVTLSDSFSKTQSAYEAMVVRDYFMTGKFDQRHEDIARDKKQLAVRMKQLCYDCRSGLGTNERIESLFNTARNMTSYLSPRELDAVWKKMESGPCSHSLSSVEKNLVALFKATGKRDGLAMVRASKLVLETAQSVHPAIVKYSVAVGMLGSLMQGDREGSLKFWSTYRPVIFGDSQPDMLFRLLVADSLRADSSSTGSIHVTAIP